MSSYLDTCKATANGIDVVKLGKSHFIGEPAKGGGDYGFRSIGSISIAGNDVYPGVKIPDTNVSAFEILLRLCTEVAIIDIITSRSPDLLPKVSRFTCLVVIEGDEDPVAILTEDFTESGKKSMVPAAASEAVRDSMYRPFRNYGNRADLLDEETLELATACLVEGVEERLHDFTPNPFIHRQFLIQEFTPHMRTVSEFIPGMTVAIPRDSSLSSELLNS